MRWFVGWESHFDDREAVPGVVIQSELVGDKSLVGVRVSALVHKALCSKGAVADKSERLTDSI